jgi:hypothetical protein
MSLLQGQFSRPGVFSYRFPPERFLGPFFRGSETRTRTGTSDGGQEARQAREPVAGIILPRVAGKSRGKFTKSALGAGSGGLPLGKIYEEMPGRYGFMNLWVTKTNFSPTAPSQWTLVWMKPFGGEPRAALRPTRPAVAVPREAHPGAGWWISSSGRTHHYAPTGSWPWTHRVTSRIFPS